MKKIFISNRLYSTSIFIILFFAIGVFALFLEPQHVQATSEICGNGIDDDGDSYIDEEDASDHITWYFDDDGDGFGDPDSTPLTQCAQPTNYVDNSDDCNDEFDYVTNGETYYIDSDEDGYGDSSSSQTKCYGEQTSGYVLNNDDCDDADSNTGPPQYWANDNDGDGFGLSPRQKVCEADKTAGYVASLNDCDDSDASRNPNTSETCDGVDTNCSCYTGLMNFDWKEFSAGQDFGLAIKEDGTLWGWGKDTDGQMGDGSSSGAAHSYPTQIENDKDWHSIATARATAAGIKTNGTLWLWGKGSYGVNGDSSAATLYVPTQLGTDTDWQSIDMARDTALAIKTNGTLWAWGLNNDGEYGNGTTSTSTNATPTQVGTETTWSTVSVGVQFVVAIKTDGTLWTWGSNTKGQLGDGTTTDRLSPTQESGNDTDWQKAIACDNFTLAIKTDGTLWGWGSNGSSQLAAESSEFGNKTSPYQISSDSGWKDLTCTMKTSFAIKEDGTLWGWGKNIDGLLAHGTESAVYSQPMIIEPEFFWITVSASLEESYVFILGASKDTVTEKVYPYSWGNSDDYELGADTTFEQHAPIPMALTKNGCNTDETDATDAITYYRDSDADSYGNSLQTKIACSLPTGYVSDSSDCNDADSSINPLATETCNGIDDNCDGTLDEGFTSNTYYLDSDNDTYGDSQNTITACDTPSGYTTDATDCNDQSAIVYPGATETCNGVDDDCDNTIDEGFSSSAIYYLDSDNDTYGDASNSITACAKPTGYVSDSSDCNDADSSINPLATETCNGIDDNCDGTLDEGFTSNTYYLDSDNDTYGDFQNTITACDTPSGYTTDATDCNDQSATVYPGATELCNGIDDDCDNTLDEGFTSNTYYLDSDGDTFGSTTSTTACDVPSGYSITNTDCNDSEITIYLGATERCNGVDDDCDSVVDEDVSSYLGEITFAQSVFGECGS